MFLSLTKVTLLVFVIGVDAGQKRKVDGTCNKQQTVENCESTGKSHRGIKSFVETKSFLRNYLGDYELEVYPFTTGWYNDYVDKINKDFHKFSYPEDTIGFIILNTPNFFDKVLKSFVRKFVREQGIDALETLTPMKECMDYFLSELKQGLSPVSIEYISAGEKVNATDKYFGVQAAGDVSGGVRYYRREDVVPDHWPQNKTIYGTSIHPKFGGWFKFRGALIFPELQYSGLLRVQPEDVLPTRDLRIELLEQVNNFDERWRDVIDVEKRYSAEQSRFFNYLTSKEDKIAMMRGWVEDGTS